MNSSFFNWKGHAAAALSARFYLGWIFVFASIHKLVHPADFALDVATYDIVPLFLINIMAVCLPYIELAAGVLLITGIKSRAASWLVSGMMLMFLAALLLALHKGIDMSCGCFASSSAGSEDMISYKTVWRDTIWLLLALYVLFFDNKPLGIPLILNKLKNRRSK